MLWRRPVRIASLAGGAGTAIAVTAMRHSGDDRSRGFWFDAYTGVGGKTGPSGNAFGTDGVRMATTPAEPGNLSAFAPDGRELWSLSPPPSDTGALYFENFSGRVYQGARRIL
ncbi:hypothetical protein [Gordonia iterans]